MVIEDSRTERLVSRAADGDGSAIGKLIGHYRDRLRHRVSTRIDRRLSARLDASDVVQETMAEAARQLPEYARKRPLPFYPWLCRLARQRLHDLSVFHIRTAKRSVRRERRGPNSKFVSASISQGKTSAAGPGTQVIQQEENEFVHQLMDDLPARQREVIFLRHMKRLRVKEIAAQLGTSEAAIKMLHLRAVQHMRACCGNQREDR